MNWTRLAIVVAQQLFETVRDAIGTGKKKSSEPVEGEVNSSQRDIAISTESGATASREGKLVSAKEKKKREEAARVAFCTKCGSRLSYIDEWIVGGKSYCETHAAEIRRDK